MPSPSLFSDSSPTLWACWTLGPCYRVKHDRNRTDKITYTARLILVTDGEVLFKSNGKDLPTVPETLLYLPPGCLYDSDFITDELTSRNLFFDFDSDRSDRERFTPSFTRIIPTAGTVDAALIRPFPGFADAPELSSPFTVQADPELEGLIDSIMTESVSHDPFAHVRTRILLTDLLIRILRKKRGSGAAKTSETYRCIAEYVEAHLSEKLSGRELSQALNYHPNYMNRVVSRITGLNLHEFILQAKLRRAETLLVCTNQPIADIAQSLAFYDSGHFARIFASHRGVTPNIFRNTSRQM
ncbi:MAG: helix-turn-helix transcriptional regulator [Clostridia bacterium]|nr:helix-turn-helix transcriptional regulator [Clostridia bacterium]